MNEGGLKKGLSGIPATAAPTREKEEKKKHTKKGNKSSAQMYTPPCQSPPILKPVILLLILLVQRKVVLVHGLHIRIVAPSLLLLLIRLDHALTLIALPHLPMSHRSIRRLGGAICDRRSRIAGFVHQPARISREPLVDLLEALTRRLDDEEVDDGDEQGVQQRVEQVEAPVEIVDADGGGLYDDVVEEPVAGGGERGALSAHAERVDLGRVEPGDGDPAEAEGEEVEGDEDGGDDAGDVVPGVMADFRADGDAEEGDAHGGGHGHEEGPPAEPLDEEEGGGRGEHVEDGDAGGEDVGGEFGEADAFVEDEGEVVAEDVDAGELLAGRF